MGPRTADQKKMEQKKHMLVKIVIVAIHDLIAWRNICKKSILAVNYYRKSSQSADFSIAQFYKNMNSSHEKVHPLYSKVFTVYFYEFIQYIYEINNSSHAPKKHAMRWLPVLWKIYSLSLINFPSPTFEPVELVEALGILFMYIFIVLVIFISIKIPSIHYKNA